MKHLIKNGDIIQFFIRKKYGADLPVNFTKNVGNRNNEIDHSKIENILKAKKQNPLDILPSLTDLYDDNLELKKVVEETKNELEILKEKQ